MVLRQAGAIGGRFVGNLWAEFWPDARLASGIDKGRPKPALRS
jgi:hypothetical protein